MEYGRFPAPTGRTGKVHGQSQTVKGCAMPARWAVSRLGSSVREGRHRTTLNTCRWREGLHKAGFDFPKTTDPGDFA